MKEIDFYEEFSEKFIKYLRGYIESNIEIAYSVNKSLDLMIKEVSTKLNTEISFENEYIPKLKLDILFAIRKENKTHLILFEVKYLRQLSLKDYSQLSGYLQVAKNINTGILLLVVKGSSPNKLSNDFNEIIKLKKLPMDWVQTINDKQYPYKTGIISFQPGNGINWIDSKVINGISNFEELASIIKKATA
ncbi:hypothetical protein INR75_13320 [Zunongwangia sp. SCSIO 43204]|uniref:hypothetical protein n=1 Tax=Zunongwangia sp. SCSIO 43204 TaxID=2779359 RepID=UPI001CA863AF|nr:hypothetical protein [Zunongwangia sp. SCSIO 43204]UAB83171.1 hypothetical protein INR75_13320 [Zunongwangia sp. SCSIO 43204]